MKVFLTGGTGYLGEHIARDLCGAGHQVLALVRNPKRSSLLKDLGVEILIGDLLRPQEWKDRLRDVEAVVHTGGMVEAWSTNPELFDRTNVEAPLILLDLCRSFGIQKIVVTSSFFALGPTGPGEIIGEDARKRPPSAISRINDYVRTKTSSRQKLQDLQDEGSPVIQVYPTILLGPGNRTAGNHTATVLSDIGRGSLPGLIGNGEQLWNLVPVAAAARGHRLALERGKPGGNYILGGENWTQRQLVERAAFHMKVKNPTRKLPTGLLLCVAGVAEAWARVWGKTPILTRGAVRLYDCNWGFTSEKARKELGYEFAPVEDTVAETVRWLKEDVWPKEPGGGQKS